MHDKYNLLLTIIKGFHHDTKCEKEKKIIEDILKCAQILDHNADNKGISMTFLTRKP